jgi:parallel beta-helix repeat protein
MIRKIIAIGLLVALMGTVLPILGMVPIGIVSAAQNPPHDDGLGLDAVDSDGIWTTDGNWIIESTDSITYTAFPFIHTILVNGDLIIQPGGSLTILGINLLMNPAFNGQFQIRIESNSTDGGTFIIRDVDNDPQTKSDVSNVTSATPGGNNRFGFIVQGPHGDLQMSNSELNECGWDGTEGLQYQDAGLWIGSSDITISDNYISNCYNGITIYGASTSNVIVQNNNISHCESNGTFVKLATDITITNNEFYDENRGVFFDTSSNAYVTNNKIDSIFGFGAAFEGVNGVEFNYNIITNLKEWMLMNWVGAFFGDYCSNINADHNTIKDCLFSGMLAIDYYGWVNFTNNTFDNPVSGSAFGVAYGENAFFYRNSVGKNKTQMGTSDSAGHWIGPITGSAYVIECEAYNLEQWTYINWGAGVSMWGVETVVIKDNIFSDNEGSGAYLIDCGNISVSIEDNIMENNGIGIGFNEPSSPPTYGGVKNANINNNAFNSNFIGIRTEAGSNQRFTNNTIDGNTEAGIANHVDGTYIANNVITNTGEGDNEYEGGIGLLGTTENPLVENVIIHNNTIENNYGPLTFPVDGIFLEDTDNILIEDCYFSNNEIAIHTYHAATKILVENSTISGGFNSLYDFRLETDSNVTTLNTTFDNSSTDVRFTSELTCKWYLNVRVMQGGLGVNGTNVFINDSKGAYDPQIGQPFVSSNYGGEDGWVKWIQVTEYKESDNIKDYFTSHWVNASMGPSEGFSRPNIWTSLDIFINLNGRVQVIDLKAPPYIVNRTETIFFFANGTDIEDGEGWFTAEFEYIQDGLISGLGSRTHQVPLATGSN